MFICTLSVLLFLLTPHNSALAASAFKFWCDTPSNVNASARVPAGFCVRRFATVRAARTLDLLSNGDVLVGAPNSGTPGGAGGGLGGVYVLYDDNGDGLADDAQNVLFKGGDTFHGIRAVGNYLYYSESEKVMRIPFSAGDRKKSSASPELVADLSTGGSGDRFTHTIDAHPLTGELFVTTGRYDESSCTTAPTRSGAVLRIGAKSTAAGNIGDIVVGRCRNPMYMRCKSFGCYVMELSGDSWGGVGGTEKLVAIVNDTDIGFPCCVQPNKPYGSSGTDCSKITHQIADFPLTDTPFGFDWDDKRRWPAPYTGRLFIGNHGSFYTGGSGNPNAFEDAGLISIEWDYVNKRPVNFTAPGVAGKYPQFVSNGWGGAGQLGERVTDVMFHPDGRLFLADDYTGYVLWIAPTNLMTNGTFVPLGDVPTTTPTASTAPTTGGGSTDGGSATGAQSTTSTSSSSSATGASDSTAPTSVSPTGPAVATTSAARVLSATLAAVFVCVAAAAAQL